jgi:hypothetical protein
MFRWGSAFCCDEFTGRLYCEVYASNTEAAVELPVQQGAASQ